MQRSLSILVTLGITADLLIAVHVRGEDWLQFRGPTGQGISTAKNLPIKWSDTRNVAWKQAVPGTGWSSPVLYNARIYLTSGVPVEGSATGNLSLVALCLDAGTGRVIWSEQIFVQDGATAPSIHKKNSHASATPLVEEEHVDPPADPRGDASGSVFRVIPGGRFSRRASHAEKI